VIAWVADSGEWHSSRLRGIREDASSGRHSDYLNSFRGVVWSSTRRGSPRVPVCRLSCTDGILGKDRCNRDCGAEKAWRV
jgi:hypothetical protein